MRSVARRSVASWMLVACGAWLVGLGFYFAVLRPPLLPEDMRFMDATSEHLRSSLPDLERWLSQVFTVMGGFMAGAGVLTVFVARMAIPSRAKGAGLAVAAAGMLTVALMSAVNFVLQSDFRWILLGPPLLWFSALAIYVTDSRLRQPGRPLRDERNMGSPRKEMLKDEPPGGRTR